MMLCRQIRVFSAYSKQNTWQWREGAKGVIFAEDPALRLGRQVS